MHGVFLSSAMKVLSSAGKGLLAVNIDFLLENYEICHYYLFVCFSHSLCILKFFT